MLRSILVGTAAAAAAAVTPLVALPAPAANAGVLCSVFSHCGHFHLTANSTTYVTVECDGKASVRVQPGKSTPNSCDASGFRVPKSGYNMARRRVGHDGFVYYTHLTNGKRYGISDGIYWTVRKRKA